MTGQQRRDRLKNLGAVLSPFGAKIGMENGQLVVSTDKPLSDEAGQWLRECWHDLEEAYLAMPPDGIVF